ncbi:MAG: AMP-binding protein [Gammaproteobacteria bacterium]|nr:AMP-binding protein [Gammaproteobacteria bacterium]
MVKTLLRFLLGSLYRVQLCGLENAQALQGRALIVANHTSYLDALLLAVFLPGRPLFAINTLMAQRWWMRPLHGLVRLLPMDPTNPMSIKTLIRHLKADEQVVIFPEGRITRTGSLMKIYDGSAMAADRANAPLLPVRLDGPQYTPFSYLQGTYRLRWFPQVRISLLPQTHLGRELQLSGRARRRALGAELSEIMAQMMFSTSQRDHSLFDALLAARRIHGGKHQVLEDIQRKPLNYNDLISRCEILGGKVAESTQAGDRVGLLLPSSSAAVVLFFALSSRGRVPAMLNFTLGAHALRSACATACIGVIYSSRRFVAAAKLEQTLAELGEGISIRYLEDLAEEISLADKLRGWLLGRLGYRPHQPEPQSPAVVLFTSGSEGAPKGVVLSHHNLLSNQAQMAARVDFSPRDLVCNALPMFHSFGLTAGTLLPLLNGLYCFLYPSPLHYRVVPEIAYDTNATILFGTNSFLAGYAKHAHPYDFYNLRYVFAGAEKLTAETREVWMSKFGKRILEGYGATETSPVIAVNSAMAMREGSVGRFLPGIDWRLEPVPGVERGGRLYVKGPNVMLGYLLPSQPGELAPPSEGWYDTGDIVEVDGDGFIHILGRAKRFAKIAGEMVSLGLVEEIAGSLWPDHSHAVITRPDPRKGEQLILFTTQPTPERSALAQRARQQGISELHVPRELVRLDKIPLLATGKTDYPGLQRLLSNALGSEGAA